MSSEESLGTPGLRSLSCSSGLLTVLSIIDSGMLGQLNALWWRPPTPNRIAAFPFKHHILFSELVLCVLN